MTVKLERDPSGQVIKEWQNDQWIASSYDELGSRLQVTSSLGAQIDVARNEMGNVAQIPASRADQEQWTAAMQYNELGQEIERILPGNVISQWQYDVTGRPTNHRISSQNRQTRRRVYQWDVNHRLKGMLNGLTAGQVTHGYDEFSNLVLANQVGQFDFLPIEFYLHHSFEINGAHKCRQHNNLARTSLYHSKDIDSDRSSSEPSFSKFDKSS